MSRDERTTLWCGVEWTSETRQHSETGEHLGVGGLEFSMEIALLAAAARSGVRAPRLPFPTSLIFDFILFFILSPSLSPHSHLPPITTPLPPQHRQNGRQRRPGTSAPPESSAVLRECSDTTPRCDNKADSFNSAGRLLIMLTTPSYSTSSTPSSPPMPVPPPPTPCSVLP